MPTKTAVASVSAALLASLAAAHAAHAELVTYTIDPSRSTLTLGGTLTNNTAFAQSAGSTTASYSGTITANRTGDRIEFPGGSLLFAATGGNYQPDDDASGGSSDPANYCRTAPGPSFQTSFEAIRGLQLDVFDDTSGAGSLIATNSTFQSNALQVVVDAGESDAFYGIGSNPDNTTFVNKGTSNGNNNGLSSVETAAGIETLTLKFSTGAIAYNVAQSNDSSLSFTGTITATRVVPEPAAGLMAVAAAGLLSPGRRSTICRGRRQR